jgi:hypothetical protein
LLRKEFFRLGVYRGLEVLFQAVEVATVVAVVEGLEAADDEFQPVQARGEGLEFGKGHGRGFPVTGSKYFGPASYQWNVNGFTFTYSDFGGRIETM